MVFRKRFPVIKGVSRGECSALVACLGNPGEQYRFNRHNAGFLVGDVIEEKAEVLRRSVFREGYLCVLLAADTRFLLLKPYVFMNRSGEVVAPVVRQYGLGAGDLIVVHDDIDIPLGEVRTKRGGGSGGHRGVESVIEGIGSEDFHRVRVGVGRPPEGVDPADYVLGDFAREERDLIEVSVRAAAGVAIDLALNSSQRNAAGG